MKVAVLECISQITDGVGYIVLLIVGWDCKVTKEKGNSVGNSFSPGIWDVCLVAAVVVVFVWAIIYNNTVVVDCTIAWNAFDFIVRHK